MDISLSRGSSSGPRALLPVALLAAVGLTGLPGATPGKAQEASGNLHYPTSDELEALLKTADQARLKSDWAEAITLYQSALDQDEKNLTTHPMRRAGQPTRLLGVTEWAIRGLRGLSTEGRLAYRKRFDYRANAALNKALASPEPYLALARAYELFPISTAAAKILSHMAERSLERGELARARKVLRRLVEHHALDVAKPALLHRQLLICALGLGDAEATREHFDVLRKLSGGEKVHLNGRPLGRPELIAMALEREALRKGQFRGATPSAPLARGDTRNRAQSSGEATFGRVIMRPYEFSAGPRWRRRAGGGRHAMLDTPARNLSVVHKGMLFATTADTLFALDLATGRPPARRLRRPDRPMYSDDNLKVQLAACVAQGVVVAPFVERVQFDQSFRGIPIKVKIPTRKLAGFDVDRWGWSWDHARLLRDTPLRSWSFPSPPIAQEGRVYASAWSIEGYVNANVAAFDARTGKPLWSTLSASGQVEQTMFGEQATEPLCVPVAVHDGVVYQCTSLGCVVALDADTGRPLWITEYDTIEVRPPRGYYADHRNIVWENNAPVIEGDTLIVTPLDSRAIYGFDLTTGERKWKAPQRSGNRGTEAEMRYVMGSAGGRVVFGGEGDVRCHDARGGKLVWRKAVTPRTVAGRGCIIGRTVCVPLDDGSVVTYDLVSGKRLGQTRLATSGNLLACGRMLVITGNGEVAAHDTRSGAPRSTRKTGRDFK